MKKTSLLGFTAMLLLNAITTFAEEEPKRLIFRGQDDIATGNQIKTIEAARITRPPVLDGKLDDACWEAANPISGFRLLGSESLARVQTVGYVVYDDENLYVGFGCLEPETDNLKIRPTEQVVDPNVDEGSVFSYDSVELMVKPSHWAPEYFQIATDISGATWDAFRTHGGGTINDEWRGVISTVAQVGEDHWSVEIRVPFYCLDLVPGVRSDWRINLCRSKQRPQELSSISREGLFNEAHKFALLNEINVDFSRFFFNVSRPELVAEVGQGAPAASAWSTLANNTGKDRRVNVEFIGSDGPVRSQELTLRSGQVKLVNLGSISLSDQPIEGTSVYEVLDGAPVRQIIATDADTGEKLTLSNLQYPNRLKMLSLNLVRPNDDEKKNHDHPLVVEVSSAIGEAARKNGQIELRFVRADTSEELVSRTLSASQQISRISVDRDNWPTGRMEVHAEFRDATDRSIAKADRSFSHFPPRETVGKVLNNWVTELINIRARKVRDQGPVTFTNPRNGWVFLSVSSTGGKAELALNGNGPVVFSSDKSDPAFTREAMRWLTAGNHTVTLELPAGAALKHLIVRAIPELAYWRFPTRGDYNHLVTEEIFQVVNTIGCTRAVSEEPEFQHLVERWKKQGKRLIIGGAHVPAYSIPELTADKAYNFWRGYVGYSRPRFDAIIVDEFGVGDFPIGAYEMMAQALRRLTTEFPEKRFYPFVLDIYGVQGVKSFMEAVIDNGSPIVWEWYEREEPDMERGWNKINSTITHAMGGWRDFLFEAENHMEVCLGYYNLVGESLNENPAVDFKVWMDMQYNQLATHPAFEGLYGVMEYNAKMADEETLRWQAALHRHYGLEGKTNLLSDEHGYKYRPGILQNPDFDNGMDSWNIDAAEVGSINTGTIPGLGRLEGRVRGSSRGDNLLRTKRSAKAPNRFSQAMKNLVPGRLYCLKMITADYRDLVNGISAEKKHAVSIDIENIESLSSETPFQQVFESSRGQEANPFSRDNQPWFNFHWRVFRAKDATAKLTVTDWIGKEPGGPVGQELMYNFIEVQPYFNGE